MQWIKEVEMVESVDDLKSSRSIKGTPGPDFELLIARNASALNKIIQNTRFKKKSVWFIISVLKCLTFLWPENLKMFKS